MGVIDGVILDVCDHNHGSQAIRLLCGFGERQFDRTPNPVTVKVSIGVDSGTTPVTATILSRSLATAH